MGPTVGRSSRLRVYLGGTQELRLLMMTLATVGLMTSLIFLVYARSTHDTDGLLLAAATIGITAGGVIVCRAQCQRALVVEDVSWSLVPLFGATQRMPRIVDVHTSGSDVIALVDGGRVLVLGVAPSTFGRAAATPASVAALLRQCDRLGSVG